jgi:sec-independent protein translocase protein TatA
MGSLGPIHWIIVAVVALLLFGGRGKLSGVMGDAAKGIKAFRDGLKDEPASGDVAENKATGALPRTEAEKEELRKS